jgi:sugar lactone lactonase YvrE
VSAPTISPHDVIYAVAPNGEVRVHASGFGRPQGLAFDPRGRLFVIEALAGASGLYVVDTPEPRELALSGPGLIGVAFAPGGGLVVCSNETVYRLTATET